MANINTITFVLNAANQGGSNLSPLAILLAILPTITPLNDDTAALHIQNVLVSLQGHTSGAAFGLVIDFIGACYNLGEAEGNFALIAACDRAMDEWQDMYTEAGSPTYGEWVAPKLLSWAA